MQSVVAILAIIASIIVVFLNYWKETKTKQKTELYLKKQKFYEDLINLLNSVLYREDSSHGRELTKLYNLAYIYSNDEVIEKLNAFFMKVEGRDTVPATEVKEIIGELLIASRKDLGITTNLQSGKNYNAPYVQIYRSKKPNKANAADR